MKKWTRIFLIMILTVMAIGCIKGGTAQTESTDTNGAQASNEVISENVSPVVYNENNEESSDKESLDDTKETNENTVETADPENTVKTSEGSHDVDVDLTAISGILVYSEVYNMMSTPENYLGKKIKMEGIYTIYFNDSYSIRYDACIVQDATACCATGIEFELSDELKFPDDYPEEGDIITVEGIFDTYEEDGYTYCTLRNASLLNVKK
ncbi:MAG: hypothetical protein IKS60_07245 [Lachnospiraceae bacterium]|nr:hypothetical protein [Lachnospiraceae bacterium]MBR4413393.1 hypothetical protein [Lachnospiraceae bacterium]MBR5916674.1 hypothetical protein [Lachnospiraceae bacterium]